MPTNHNNQLDPLEVKHRAERLSRDFNLKLNAEYFTKVHNRSLARVYDAFAGNAPGLLQKINKHLDVIEERCKKTVVDTEASRCSQ